MTEEEINSPKAERANIPPPKVLVHQASEPDKSENNLGEHQEESEEAGADPHDMIEVENPPKASPETGESTLRKETGSPIETDERENITQRDFSPQIGSGERNAKEDVAENEEHLKNGLESKGSSQLTIVGTIPEIVPDSAQEINKPEENEQDQSVTQEISKEVVADGKTESDVLVNDGLAHSIIAIDIEKSSGSEADMFTLEKIGEPLTEDFLEGFERTTDEIDVPSADFENVTTPSPGENTNNGKDQECDEYTSKKSKAEIEKDIETSDIHETDVKEDATKEAVNSNLNLETSGQNEKDLPDSKDANKESEHADDYYQKSSTDEDATSHESRANSAQEADQSEIAISQKMITEEEKNTSIAGSHVDTVVEEEISNTNPVLEEPVVGLHKSSELLECEEDSQQIGKTESESQDPTTALSEADSLQNRSITESLDVTSVVNEVDKSESSKHDSSRSDAQDITANIGSTSNEPSSQGDEQNQDYQREQELGSISKLSNASEESESPTVVEHEVVEDHDNKTIREMSEEDNSLNLTRQLEQFQEEADRAENARLLVEGENQKLREEIQRLEREKSGQSSEMDELRLRLERLTKDDQDNVQNNKKLMDEVQTLKDRIAKLQQNLDHHVALNNGNSNMVEPSTPQNKKSSVCTIL